MTYLAHYEPGERTNRQIIEDLNLDLDEVDLDERLRKLAVAELIYRVADKRYQGLGDPIFAMVFRKIYGDLIRDFTPEEVRVFYSQIPLTEEHQAYALDLGLLYSDGQRLAAY